MKTGKSCYRCERMEDVRRVLSRGGALQKAQQVFVMVMGKDGDLTLPEVQRVMGELTVSLDKEADVTLHVSSEKNFAAGAI